MEQLTKEQAIKIAESEIWRDMTPHQIVEFQLFQSRLCMPIDVFMKSLNEVLGRSVYTHELAFHKELIKEFLGEKPAPTFEDIINLIPEEKRIIINLNDHEPNNQ